jgi:hypothetical protein
MMGRLQKLHPRTPFEAATMNRCSPLLSLLLALDVAFAATDAADVDHILCDEHQHRESTHSPTRKLPLLLPPLPPLVVLMVVVVEERELHCGTSWRMHCCGGLVLLGERGEKGVERDSNLHDTFPTHRYSRSSAPAITTTITTIITTIIIIS